MPVRIVWPLRTVGLFRIVNWILRRVVRVGTISRYVVMPIVIVIVIMVVVVCVRPPSCGSSSCSGGG